jgi:hypothetical protein
MSYLVSSPGGPSERLHSEMGIQDFIEFYDNRGDRWPTVQAPLFDDPRRIKTIGTKNPSAYSQNVDSVQLIIERRNTLAHAVRRGPADHNSWRSVSGESSGTSRGSASGCGIAKCDSHVTVDSTARLTGDVWLRESSYRDLVRDNPYTESSEIIGEYVSSKCDFGGLNLMTRQSYSR